MRFLPSMRSNKVSRQVNGHIPEKIRELLWIQDYREPIRETKVSKLKVGGIIIEIDGSSYSEPSMINLKEKVKPCTNPLPLDYYPNYSQLSKCQKYTYLKWLSDITEPIEIGYPFIFYYGLERHLLMGEFEKSIYMIDELRSFHNNSSFLSYSSNAMLFACLYHKRLDLFNEFETKFQFSSLYVLVKLLLTGALSSEDIMSSAKYVGFNNHRYIKDYPHIFVNEIEKILKNKYKELFYRIDYNQIKESPKKRYNVFANISFYNRETMIFDIFENKNIKITLYSILSDSHDATKETLKALRKQGKAPSKKQTSEKSTKNKDIRVFKLQEEQLLNDLENTTNRIDLHFIYMNLSNLYYSFREDNNYFKKSEFYAFKDIELFPEVYKDIVEEFGIIPSLPMFNRLAIIYEKTDRTKEAIDICNEALKYVNASEKRKHTNKINKLLKKFNLVD